MDSRRVGMAMRRRMGAPSNVYDDTMKQPEFNVGDHVRARGRYRDQTVNDVVTGDHGVHNYSVTGGKGQRQTWHGSGDLRKES